MSKHIENLLAKIETYCKGRGIKTSTFGKLAMNDGKFVQRLKDGGSVRVETIDRLETFMSSDEKAA
ncbi:MAG TPA: hypothetical protein DD397_06875 [Hyphomonas sp.]|jgi:hypothetical protein|uniref:hypothetical protein n=1 Tax=Hyphomonas sp. TaxID=87 RepID=UPI000E819A15|nr:hypothetical protein [Hyphomonas sp.]QDP49059.1 MAG: hypothetical protein Unbinned4811contig1001_4 [Prokaryotic dsDNA virus sp.]HBN92269.1 hypothetical protein [Hyphomonas sp.]|tara:strand:+ start:2119 stop:2316 length:198 start_codon:yes stop_codon:yes gene_type:complete